MKAVVGVAVRRERSRVVVPHPGVPAEVDGADGDHERVVAGRVGDAHGLTVRAVVAGRRDDCDPAEPELLDRAIERIGREVAGNRRVEREVRDLDVVVVLVVEDPLAGRDDVARPADAVVVHDVERDDLGRRSRARVPGRRARRDAGHERAVAAAVTGRVVRKRRQVDVRQDATREVGPGRVDPGVDDRDRGHRGGVRARVGAPEGRVARLGGPELGRRVGRARAGHLRPRVEGHGQARHLREAVQRAGRDLGRNRADQVELLLDVAETLDRALRGRGALPALDDDVELLARIRLGLREQPR